jgi:hypothetical protein
MSATRNPPSLLYWLKHRPGLAALRLQTPAGERVLKFDVSSRRPYAEAERNIRTMQASSVEALNAKGDVIGALALAEEEDEEVLTPDAVDAPVNVNAGPDSAQHLNLVAKLIADAYKHSTTTAFDRLGGIVELLTARFSQQDKMIQQLQLAQLRSVSMRARRAAADSEPTAEDGEGMNGMLAGLLQGILASKMGNGPMAQAVAAAAAPQAVARTNGTRAAPHVVDVPAPEPEDDETGDDEDDDEAKE